MGGIKLSPPIYSFFVCLRARIMSERPQRFFGGSGEWFIEADQDSLKAGGEHKRWKD